MLFRSGNYLVKAADIPGLSYQATYNGTDGITITSACEPLDVVSSITSFSYAVVAGNGATQAGPFNCTLETSSDTNGNAVKDLCAVGKSAANVSVSTRGTSTSDFLVTVTVANNTGVNIWEKVQGGLAAKATYCSPSTGACYTSGKVNFIPATDVTCGGAVIDLSSAKTTGGSIGNVVIWGDGTTATNQLGFQMADGQTCTLQVIVRKGYSSTELQAVTSSWSELQTLVDGPNAGFSEKSPYTGSLAACVQSNGSPICNQ